MFVGLAAKWDLRWAHMEAWSSLLKSLWSVFCLFMEVRKHTAFLLLPLFDFTPCLPKCRVVMPTSSLNQDRRNDCTPTALLLQRSRIQTSTNMFPTMQQRGNTQPSNSCLCDDMHLPMALSEFLKTWEMLAN